MKPTNTHNTPLVLVIRDGWGQNPHPSHDPFNAVKLARTPVDVMLRRDWPACLVKTSGLDVGVPADQTGNSEVGHQNIGAGRIVDQEVVRINKACETGAINTNPAVTDSVRAAITRGGSIHLMGIASDAGVHGLLEHLYALVTACKRLNAPRVFVHLFTDGRDTVPTSGRGFVERVEIRLREIGLGRVATVIGRYWSMDRDHRWDRVKIAYDALTGRAACPRFATGVAAIDDAYANPGKDTKGNAMVGDEFVLPRIIAGSDADAAASRVKSGDCILFYNYRGDRPREIVSAFVLPDEQWKKVKAGPDGAIGFDRGTRPDVTLVAMTGYSEALLPYVKVAFPKPPKMPRIAGEVISSLGLRQLRVAETEKFPHVTFFFNDYRDEPFPGESRVNPPSPRVATYDLKPEMAAAEVRDAVLARLASPDCEEFIVVNFANADMVGHTGKLDAAIKAVETTDACTGAIIDATLSRGGSLIVTADHGNAEQMWEPEQNAPHTAHTPYDVPLYVVGAAFKGRTLRGGMDRPASERGRLADVMPTALAMMGIAQPAEMTGRSLLI